MSSNATSTSAIFHLQLVAKYLNITLGFSILIGGVLGNLLNIVVFITLGNYKRNACSLFMLAQSFFDLNVILVGTSTRLLSQGFQIDFTSRSRIWCKLRTSIIDINDLSSLTCLCLQSIDVFFCTSRSVIWRQKSNIRMARYLVIGCVLLWSGHQLPYFLLQDLVSVAGTPTCLTINALYAQYRTYFLNLGLYLTLPVSTITIFAILTYRRLRALNIHQRRSLSALTRQMVHMALAQIAVVLLFLAPYGIATAYFVGTAGLVKGAYRLAQEQVAQLFFVLYAYGTFASSFYCYYAASKTFRKQVSYVIKRLASNHWRIHRILPLTPNIHIPTTQQQTAQT